MFGRSAETRRGSRVRARVTGRMAALDDVRAGEK